jgi:AcrR family transcriptional regulator
VPPAGIEPAHIGLKVRCSTAELRRRVTRDCIARGATETRCTGYAGSEVSAGGLETGGRRRRRSPEVAQGEIVAAAEALLHERPFRELTVDEVMRRTDLSRPSFYVYFRDRHHLILRVVEHLGTELRTMSQRWYTGAGDGPAQAREAMEGIVDVYAVHGPVLRALADAAADDREVERVYGGLVQRFVDVTERHIEAEMEAGRVLPLDACETARALVWMMERYLNLTMGRARPRSRDTVAETLTTIWTRVLYGVS